MAEVGYNGLAQESIIFLFDKRVGKIEDSVMDMSRQMQSQSETMETMSAALTAVVRLEERLTASIENTRDQKASLQRVHERMDQTLSALTEQTNLFRDMLTQQTAETERRLQAALISIEKKQSEIENELGCQIRKVRDKIESGASDVTARVEPLERTQSEQAGALKLAKLGVVILSGIASVTIGMVSYFYGSMNNDLRDISRAFSKHEAVDAGRSSQIEQMRKELDSLNARMYQN